MWFNLVYLFIYTFIYLFILDVLDKAIQVEDQKAEQMPLPLKQSSVLNEKSEPFIEFVPQYDETLKVRVTCRSMKIN